MLLPSRWEALFWTTYSWGVNALYKDLRGTTTESLPTLRDMKSRWEKSNFCLFRLGVIYLLDGIKKIYIQKLTKEHRDGQYIGNTHTYLYIYIDIDIDLSIIGQNNNYWLISIGQNFNIGISLKYRITHNMRSNLFIYLKSNHTWNGLMIGFSHLIFFFFTFHSR